MEARQFEKDGEQHLNNLIEWITANGGSAWHDGNDLCIKTRRGELKAVIHDWIVCDGKQFYLCDSTTFAMSLSSRWSTNRPHPYNIS